MRHAVLFTVLAALAVGAITAPFLPRPQPQGVAVEDVRAANNLLALKAGCYLVTTRSSVRASQAISALQQDGDGVTQGYETLLAVLDRYREQVRGVELGTNTTRVYLEHGVMRMGAGEAVALGLAADTPIRVRDELLKSAGQNICTGDTDEWNGKGKNRT